MGIGTAGSSARQSTAILRERQCTKYQQPFYIPDRRSEQRRGFWNDASLQPHRPDWGLSRKMTRVTATAGFCLAKEGLGSCISAFAVAWVGPFSKVAPVFAETPSRGGGEDPPPVNQWNRTPRRRRFAVALGFLSSCDRAIDDIYAAWSKALQHTPNAHGSKSCCADAELVETPCCFNVIRATMLLGYAKAQANSVGRGIAPRVPTPIREGGHARQVFPRCSLQEAVRSCMGSEARQTLVDGPSSQAGRCQQLAPRCFKSGKCVCTVVVPYFGWSVTRD